MDYQVLRNSSLVPLCSATNSTVQPPRPYLSQAYFISLDIQGCRASSSTLGNTLPLLTSLDDYFTSVTRKTELWPLSLERTHFNEMLNNASIVLHDPSNEEVGKYQELMQDFRNRANPVYDLTQNTHSLLYRGHNQYVHFI